MTFRANAIDQDWPRLAGYLETHGFRFAPDAPPRQFASGFANFNYLLEVDGAPCVLRRPPPGPLPPGAHDMVREYRVLSRLWREFPLRSSAPPSSSWSTVPGSSSGPSFHRLSPAGPTHAARIAGDLVDALIDLHRVDPAAVDLDSLSAARGGSSRVRSLAGRSAHTSPVTSNRAIRFDASSRGSRRTSSPNARWPSCTTTSSSTTCSSTPNASPRSRWWIGTCVREDARSTTSRSC